jgi:hypothetical protein
VADLHENGACLSISPNGRPMQGGAALFVCLLQPGIQHQQQAYGVSKALVCCPMEASAPVLVAIYSVTFGIYEMGVGPWS